MKILAASLTAEQTYKLMTGVVVPRPIAWITTQGRNDIVNAAPFSCYTIVAHKPPMIGVNIGSRAGVKKDTARNIDERKEFVVNIADESLLAPLHQSSTEYEPDISEVEVLGLETVASGIIATPRLAAVPVSLECTLHSVIPFGDTGAEFYVGEVVAIHVRDDLMQGGKIDTRHLNPICRLAGPNYATLGEIVTLQPVKQTERTVLTAEPAP